MVAARRPRLGHRAVGTSLTAGGRTPPRWPSRRCGVGRRRRRAWATLRHGGSDRLDTRRGLPGRARRDGAATARHLRRSCRCLRPRRGTTGLPGRVHRRVVAVGACSPSGFLGDDGPPDCDARRRATAAARSRSGWPRRCPRCARTSAVITGPLDRGRRRGREVVGRSGVGSATSRCGEDHRAGVLGWMFVLLWNTFAGSYSALTSASRL